jgi:hypothetical protein
MAERHVLAEQHNLTNEVLFYFKSFVLTTIRFFKNHFVYKIQKFPLNTLLTNTGVISLSETELWSTDDNEKNWILTAGKVHNLRTAARKLNGIEVPANQTFSFWKHIGKPAKNRGYVIGREIREGCIVPTIAGGLCQLSNALYDAALKAGFEIVERHKHTRVIKGSLAEIDRDATVKWNYIDLRFKSKQSFRIEIEIDAEKLIIKFRSTTKNDQNITQVTGRSPITKLNDCFSCGNYGCFKHPAPFITQPRKAVTTFILDEKWTEYERYVNSVAQPEDHFIIPFATSQRFKINRYSWSAADIKNIKRVSLIAIYRSLYLRVFAKTKRNIFSMMLGLDRMVARQMVDLIPVESTHVVISQNLLPFIWAEGALGGRTFDVIMTRLPIEKLHERLDTAFKKFPDSTTLNDFRSSEDLMTAENASLTKARHIITPHQEIADLFNNKSIRLDWIYPKVTRQTTQGTRILFPGSALGRKGAYEVRRLAKELNLSIVIAGGATEYNFFWNGVKTEKTGPDPFEDVKLVVYPAYVEHQPRILLRAIAAGIPVITTTATGLREMDLVTIIPTGDYDALKAGVARVLEKNEKRITAVSRHEVIL